MSKRTNGHVHEAKYPRLQIPLSGQQREQLVTAALKAGSDVNTWTLAHAMRAAGLEAAAGAPLVISGKVADLVRKRAALQGVTPSRMVELMLALVEAP